MSIFHPCPETLRPISDVAGQELLFLEWNIASFVSVRISDWQHRNLTSFDAD